MSRYASRSTLVHCLLHWAETTPNAVYLTQPNPDGSSFDITWGQAADQARRLATHLKSLNLSEGASVGLLGRNSAHWIIADVAVWMAGHVTVPLYPTLNGETAAYILDHAECKAIILGRMDGIADGWKDIEPHLPSLPMLSLPLSPRTDVPLYNDIMANNAPISDDDITLPSTSAMSTIVYTSGSTGRPKGVMHNFGTMCSVANALRDTYKVNRDDRMLSYLPLAHVAERAVVETASLYFGFRVFFADSLVTFQR
ncbi:MAG: AMP-binding protein, partial [Paraperlucidibaca sp.]